MLIYILTDEVTSYKPDETSVLYTIKGGDYAWLRYDFAYYTPEEIEQNSTLSKCYALNLYFENSVYYHAFAGTGDTDMAALYLAATQENAQSTGDLSFYLAEIDALFE